MRTGGEVEMRLEAGKELDRRCVWNWLNDVCRNPKVAFYTYSDKQQIEFAHDALTLLKDPKNEYENGFNDAMLEKQELMYEGTDGKWHKKDW